MGGISEYFYDEVKFFDRYIMNSPVLSASCYNVTKDVMISTLAARKITPPEPDAEFLSFALSKCPDLKDQGSLTRDNLIKAAAIVGDKENQLNFLRSFSRNGILELYKSGISQKYLIYDLITSEVTCFVLTQLVIMKETDTGDVIACFVTKDISRLKHFRKIATMAINSICECISIIDTQERTVSFESVSDDLTRHFNDVGIDGKIDYDTTFTGILDATAKEDDIPISEKVSIENLVRELSSKGEYIIIYDLETKQGDICRKQVIFQWFDNDHRYIAALQSDVSTTYREERYQLDKLNRDLNLKLGKDQVTGLPNKNSSEIQISERFNPKNSAIMLFDLTNLIYLNNTVGRDIGNMLLTSSRTSLQYPSLQAVSSEDIPALRSSSCATECSTAARRTALRRSRKRSATTTARIPTASLNMFIQRYSHLTMKTATSQSFMRKLSANWSMPRTRKASPLPLKATLTISCRR